MNRIECDEFAAIVQSVLDGDRSVAALRTPHAANCGDCRSLAESARTLATGLDALARFSTGRDIAADVVPAVLAERRRGRLVRRATAAAALAASVLAAVVLLPNGPEDRAVAVRETLPAKPPAVEESLREVGTAFVSLTKRTASETLAPARHLLAGIELPELSPDDAVPRPESKPGSSPLAPLANTARRAIDLFIRDVGGLAPSPQRNS